MTVYESIKYVHITTVLISISGFVLRGVWMMQASTRLQTAWVRLVPHINDIILLLSAIVLVVLSAQYPITTAWINAKIIALFACIILGTIALKRGKKMGVRIISFGLAILVFIYISMVATNKNPLIIS